jgi:hypothetical protein
MRVPPPAGLATSSVQDRQAILKSGQGAARGRVGSTHGIVVDLSVVPFALAIGPAIIAGALAWRKGGGALGRLRRSLAL